MPQMTNIAAMIEKTIIWNRSGDFVCASMNVIVAAYKVLIGL